MTPISDPDDRDSTAVFRNAGMLRAGNAFLAFGDPATWPPDVADLEGGRGAWGSTCGWSRDE